VRFQVLTAASIKMAVLWVYAPCSLVKFTDVSEALAASIIKAVSAECLMMEGVSTSKTSVNFYQTRQRNSPEDSHLQSLLNLIII
jgi:hypothetical protein